MWDEKAIEEMVSKASLTDSQKTAIVAAMKELGKMPEDEFKSAHAALAKLLGFGSAKKPDEPEPKPDLPPEVKAEWEALQKSRDEDRKALEELQKSVAAERDQSAKMAQIAKAAQEFVAVPMASEKLGELLHVVRKADEAQAGVLEELLKSTNEALRQSALFSEMGSVGGRGGSVVEKIEGMADQLIQKSEKRLTKEQAFTQVLADNPDLYNQFLKSEQ